MKADLHCHTTMSDGSLGLEETTCQCGLYAVSDYLRDVRQELLSLYGEALNALSLGEAG